jgi:hypothetical protein
MNSNKILSSGTALASSCDQLHNSANDNILCNQLQKSSLGDRVAFYADAARSSATRRAYRSDMAAFTAWGGQVPASPEMVASYLAASSSLAAATQGGVWRQLLTPTRPRATLTRLSTPWSARSSGASAGCTVRRSTLPRRST